MGPMKKLDRNKLNRIVNWSLVVITLGWVFLFSYSHLTYNITPSMPEGIYWLWPGNQPVKGQTVVLRNEIKVLRGKPGDTVEVSAVGTRVNGGPLIPMSAPILNAPYHPCPFGTYKLAEDQYWVLGNHPRSWDSRYLCGVPGSLLGGTAEALWTK